MKVQTIFFISLAGLIFLIQKTLSEKCVEYSEPLYNLETKIIDCPPVKNSLNKRQKPSSDDMFSVNFRCSIDDTELCNKVKNVFIAAGKYITATIGLKNVIKVNAQFLDFCRENGDCDTQNVILGAARPTRMIPFKDPTDNKIRLYPQALYKQLNLPDEHPELGSSEITAMFNSNMNYWFQGDPLPMSQRQVDMLYVVTHELIHGLGFTNSWNDYLNIQALTPAIGGSANGPAATPQSQFFEFIFDKSLILLPSGKSLTSITDQLNQFQVNTLSEEEFASAFMASPQFQIAKDMFNNATTHGTIGYLTTPNLPPNTQLTQEQLQNDVIILETSLVPFEPGSSIGHVDFSTYLKTSDFLMMFTYPPGQTLDQMMSRAGSTKETGPIGPKLRSLLANLGYDIKTDYNPPSINDISDSSLISFNLSLSLVCILLTFVNSLYFN